MPRTLVKGKPVRTRVSVLPVQRGKVNRPPVDARWRTRLEPKYCKPLCHKRLRKFDRWWISCPATGYCRVHAYMDAPAKKSTGRDDHSPRLEPAAVGRENARHSAALQLHPGDRTLGESDVWMAFEQ